MTNKDHSGIPNGTSTRNSLQSVGDRTPIIIMLALVLLVTTIGVVSVYLKPSSSVLSEVDSPASRWMHYTLLDALAYVAKNNTVIVCMVGEAYLLLLNNWLITVARQKHVEKVLVIAEDYPTLYTVNERWPGHAVMIYPALDPASNNYGSVGFFKIASRRPHNLLQILELGYEVMYSDVDMVWMKDPFPYLEGSHEVYYAFDGYDICTCFFYLRPTFGAKLLMRMWVKEMNSQTELVNQPPFNWALAKISKKVDDYLLPMTAFPSGLVYFGNKTWAKETEGQHAVIHNNFIVGKDNKMQRFRDHGLWLVDNHSDESPLVNYDYR